MKKLKLWTGLLALFLAGIVIGAAATRVVWQRETLGYLSGKGTGLEKVILRKLNRDLELSAGQKARIEAILCRTHTELIELRKLHRPEREQIIEQGAASIRAELSAAQQQKFDLLRENLKKARASKEALLNEGAGATPRPCD